MSVIIKRIGAMALLALVLMAQCFYAATVEAVDNVTLRQDQGAKEVSPGDLSVSFTMQLVNFGAQSFGGITAELGSSKNFENASFVSGPGTLGANQTNTYYFTADITRTADTGMVTLPVTFYYDDGTKTLASSGALFNIARGSSSSGSYGAPVLDMSYSLNNPSGFTAGEVSTLTVTVSNKGSGLVQDVRVSLTLPEKMSINNGLATMYAGTLGVTEGKSVSFPILVEKDIENKNYPIVVHMSGLGASGASGEQTIYIPVLGGEEKKDDDISPIELEISDIYLPDQIMAGEEFTLTFKVSNVGTKEAENYKLNITPEQGIVNKTRNIFAESKFASGKTREYSVTFITDKELAKKNYLIQISAAAGKDAAEVSFSQYAGIFLDKPPEAEKPAVKTPQLIVSNYDFGGLNVQAGTEFSLSMGFQNMSSKDLSNVKVSLNADGGTFIPVGSSNSFFVGSVSAGGVVGHSMLMAVSPTAEQKTTGITVTMSYEDDDGGQYSVTDIISIPVVQETRLTVDDIIGPPELYIGGQSYLNVTFHNTGKTLISNLRVTAEGNFDLVDSAAYYAGNLASGSSDSYGFNFIPTEEGSLNGRVVFSYDDPSGNPQTVDKEFSFNVVAMPGMDGGDFGEMPPVTDSTYNFRALLIAGGAAVLLIILGVVLRGIFRRRRMNRELELDDIYEDGGGIYPPSAPTRTAVGTAGLLADQGATATDVDTADVAGARATEAVSAADAATMDATATAADAEVSASAEGMGTMATATDVDTAEEVQDASAQAEEVQETVEVQAEEVQETQEATETQAEEVQETVEVQAEEVQDAAEVQAEEVQEVAEVQTEEVQEAAEAQAEEVQETVEVQAEEVREAAEVKAEEVQGTQEATETQAEEVQETDVVQVEEVQEAVEAQAEEVQEVAEVQTEEVQEAAEVQAEEVQETVEVQAEEVQEAAEVQGEKVRETPVVKAAEEGEVKPEVDAEVKVASEVQSASVVKGQATQEDISKAIAASGADGEATLPAEADSAAEEGKTKGVIVKGATESKDTTSTYLKMMFEKHKMDVESGISGPSYARKSSVDGNSGDTQAPKEGGSNNKAATDRHEYFKGRTSVKPPSYERGPKD